MRKPKWWDKPITWGDSCKASLIGGGISLAFVGAEILWLKWKTRKWKKTQEELDEE